ncbi:hypothetical protein A2U01_0009340 [Trifolium medium]|uniref:DUF7745 domain-containing protein n=1 Tax=Trifolium medium TaxID=97028 RepID=A0A392MM49_9FABA|nr:hypothetical protein [Trifolium medium]
MAPERRNTFLFKIEVDTGALTTLAQFYDPPLRCSTFQDFQLAPTLEEFEKILGYNLKKTWPLSRFKGEYYSEGDCRGFVSPGRRCGTMLRDQRQHKRVLEECLGR